MLYTMKKGRDKLVALFLVAAQRQGARHAAPRRQHVAVHAGRGPADTHHQPAVGDRQHLQQRRHPAHRLQRRIQRGGASRSKRTPTCCRSRRRPAKSPTTGSRCGSTSSSLLPVTIEAYAASGLLIKTLHFKDVKDFGGGIKRPATLETDSPLYKGYKSVMLWSGLKKAEFPRRDFHAQLPAAGPRTAQMMPARRARPLACAGCSACLAAMARGRRKNTAFDASEFEKKPFELGGYVQLKQENFALNRAGAFYKLGTVNQPQRDNLDRTPEPWNWSASCVPVSARSISARTRTTSGTSWQPITTTRCTKRPTRCGPTRASPWKPARECSAGARATPGIPIGFVERPKDPNDPELAREGYWLADADLIFNREGAACRPSPLRRCCCRSATTSTATSAPPAI